MNTFSPYLVLGNCTPLCYMGPLPSLERTTWKMKDTDNFITNKNTGFTFSHTRLMTTQNSRSYNVMKKLQLQKSSQKRSFTRPALNQWQRQYLEFASNTLLVHTAIFRSTGLSMFTRYRNWLSRNFSASRENRQCQEKKELSLPVYQAAFVTKWCINFLLC